MGYVSPFGSSLITLGFAGSGVLAGALFYVSEAEPMIEVDGVRVIRDRALRVREIERLHKRLAEQRAGYEQRVRAIEQQVAELRRLIKELDK